MSLEGKHLFFAMLAILVLVLVEMVILSVGNNLMYKELKRIREVTEGALLPGVVPSTQREVPKEAEYVIIPVPVLISPDENPMDHIRDPFVLPEELTNDRKELGLER